STWQGESTLQPRPLQKVALPAPSIHAMHFPGASQSAILMARSISGLNERPADYAGLIFNEGFGGDFTARVNMNLREDKGYTYGAYSLLYRLQRAGLFLITSMVRRDVTAASFQELYKEIEAIKGARPLSEDERAKMASGLLAGLPGRFERLDGVASQFARLASRQQPLNWLSQWQAGVKSVSLDAARAAGQALLDRNALQLFIAGDLDEITPAITVLGLPVLRYDAEGRLEEKVEAAE
ncbi:MAG: insulinase family protein, partial [Myxococcota bacterium]|nr:insulinase family protein [Myxococcota bacterium]